MEKELTNEQAKQEAIKKAFGEHYHTCFPSKDGWCMDDEDIPRKNFSYEVSKGGGLWRPASLSGIEDNNGWIRIEPDGSNLPTDHKIRYKVFFKVKRTKSIAEFPYPLNELISDYNSGFISHYKSIKEDVGPIY